MYSYLLDTRLGLKKKLGVLFTVIAMVTIVIATVCLQPLYIYIKKTNLTTTTIIDNSKHHWKTFLKISVIGRASVPLPHLCVRHCLTVKF